MDEEAALSGKKIPWTSVDYLRGGHFVTSNEPPNLLHRLRQFVDYYSVVDHDVSGRVQQEKYCELVESSVDDRSLDAANFIKQEDGSYLAVPSSKTQACLVHSGMERNISIFEYLVSVSSLDRSKLFLIDGASRMMDDGVDASMVYITYI